MGKKTIRIEDDPKDRILVVDDENSLREALKAKLTKEGYEVFTASNGQEGLDIALKEHPSLLLVDIVMPIMDGMTMMKKLREDDWGKDVPIIVLTNLGDAEKTAEAVDRGVFDILTKSDWKIEDVVDKINNELNS